MIRVTKGSDIKLFTSTINGLGDKYKIDFYTKRKDVFFSKTDLDVVVADEPYIPLFWRDLAMIGEGVLNLTVYNMTVDQSYDDGVYDNSFTRTTNYYIVNEEGDVPESLVERVENLETELAEEITRSTEFDDNCVNLINTLSEDIEAEEDVRADADDALSARIDNLSTSEQQHYSDCIQRINSEAQTRSTNDQAQVAAIDNLSGRIQTVEGQFELYYPKTQVYNKTEIDAKNLEIYGSIGSEESSRIAGDDNLQTQINQKANSSDVYGKVAVDTLLNAKADKASTYTKTEVDAAINAHTPDLSNYYTKSETNQEIDDAIDAIDLSAYETIANHNADVATLNTAIGTKANSADVYNKSEVYTKAEAVSQSQYSADMNSIYNDIQDNEEVVASALNDLNERIDDKADEATTLAGYGITDAYTKSEIDAMIGNINNILASI